MRYFKTPRRFGLLCAVALAVCLAAPAHAAKRALVVGNDNYLDRPLKNAVNDARAVAAKLAAIGYQVVKVENLRLDQVDSTIEGFVDEIRKGDEVIVFYAGHGQQYELVNYLPVVDKTIQRPLDLKRYSIDLHEWYRRIAAANPAMALFLIDACRDNAFPRANRGDPAGLAGMGNVRGVLFHFGTSPGSVAADGSGPNGLYTTHLLKHLADRVPVETMLKNVSAAVAKASNDEQQPWLEGHLAGDFYVADAGSLEPSDPAEHTDRGVRVSALPAALPSLAAASTGAATHTRPAAPARPASAAELPPPARPDPAYPMVFKLNLIREDSNAIVQRYTANGSWDAEWRQGGHRYYIVAAEQKGKSIWPQIHSIVGTRVCPAREGAFRCATFAVDWHGLDYELEFFVMRFTQAAVARFEERMRRGTNAIERGYFEGVERVSNGCVARLNSVKC